MREKDLQDYLFNNPEILFPGKQIDEKTKEFYIKGKRIDLHFVVEGQKKIVELKAVPLTREHIGQIVEYYGLMKEYLKEFNLKMILVAPSIPKWRSIFLEELGIQCIEISAVPENNQVTDEVIQKRKKVDTQLNNNIKYEEFISPNEKFQSEDFETIITKRKLALVNKNVVSSLLHVASSFSEYEIVPYKITRTSSLDFDYEYHKETKFGLNKFTKGNVWWAYRFGFQSEMPPNDKPNISLIFTPFGLDITINAELQPSQKTLLKIIKENRNKFNELLNSHGNLWFKSYLKYEHQPRFYHWILSDLIKPGNFDAETILDSYNSHQIKFREEKRYWIKYIEETNQLLSGSQIEQLNNHNKSLNLAIRLTRRIDKNDKIWNKSHNEQNQLINTEIVKMKPFIDFFIK